MADTKKRSRTEAADGTAQSWTDEERDAMKERARELKAESRRSSSSTSKKVDGEQDLLAKIAGMPEPDRAMAERIHAVITTGAPELEPKTWYGMPAYAKDGKVVCFFQPASKFKARYSTFGFSEEAQLDDGDLWPTSFGLAKLTPAVEKKLVELVKKAVG